MTREEQIELMKESLDDATIIAEYEGIYSGFEAFRGAIALAFFQYRARQRDFKEERNGENKHGEI